MKEIYNLFLQDFQNNFTNQELQTLCRWFNLEPCDRSKMIKGLAKTQTENVSLAQLPPGINTHMLGMNLTEIKKHVGIDKLSGADLSDAYMPGVDLSNADLSGTDLSSAYLSRANLTNANLSGANLSRIYLSNANLTNANLQNADLSRAHIDEAKVDGANFKGANFTLLKHFNVDWSKAILDDTQIPLLSPPIPEDDPDSKCINRLRVKYCWRDTCWPSEYTLVNYLAFGRSGTVYEVKKANDQNRFVVKIIPLNSRIPDIDCDLRDPETWDDCWKVSAEEFEEEAKIATIMGEHNIGPRIEKVIVCGGSEKFGRRRKDISLGLIIMEYAGLTVEKYKDNYPDKFKENLGILQDKVKELTDRMESMGFVASDLHLGNITLDLDSNLDIEKVKIIDFGDFQFEGVGRFEPGKSYNFFKNDLKNELKNELK